MSEDAERGAVDGETESEKSGGLGGILLMIGFLDLLLLGVALYALSLGEPAIGGGILVLGFLLTGIDLWLYRRGSF